MALPEVERKVRQGADIDSIWEILTGHSEELAHIKQAVATVETRVGKVQASQLQQSSRLDQIEDHLTKINGALNDHTTKFDALLALLHRLTGGATPPA